MNRTLRISGGLYACLLATYMHAAQLLFLPATLVGIARQEAWLSVLLDAVVTTLVGIFIGWICLQFGRRSAAQAARSAMGKAVGGLGGLIYTTYALWVSSLVLRDVQEFTTIVLLPGTPGLVVAGAMGAVALYAVWSGLEPLARIAFPTLIGTIMTMLILPVLLYPEYGLLHIDPFLSRGIGPVLEASLVSAPWFGEIILVFTLVPYLSRPGEVYRWTAIGTIGAALVVTEILVLTLLVFGPVLPSRMMFASYTLLQQISLAEIIERIELTFVVIWLATMFVKVGFYLYAAAEATTDSLGLRSHRVPAAVLAVMAVALAQIWPGVIPLVTSAGSPIYILVHNLWEGGIILIFLIAALVLRARSRVSAHA